MGGSHPKGETAHGRPLTPRLYETTQEIAMLLATAYLLFRAPRKKIWGQLQEMPGLSRGARMLGDC